MFLSLEIDKSSTNYRYHGKLGCITKPRKSSCNMRLISSSNNWVVSRLLKNGIFSSTCIEVWGLIVPILCILKQFKLVFVFEKLLKVDGRMRKLKKFIPIPSIIVREYIDIQLFIEYYNTLTLMTEKINRRVHQYLKGQCDTETLTVIWLVNY